MDERRHYPRIPLQLQSNMRVLSAEPKRDQAAPEMKASIVNLSCGGACVSITRPLEPSDVVEMQFSLPQRETPVKVYAEMVWSEPVVNAQQLVGFRFLAIRDSDVSLIAKLNQASMLNQLVTSNRG